MTNLRVDWLSRYTDDHKFDTIARAFSIIIHQYFHQNDIPHNVDVTLVRGVDKNGENREYLTIERLPDQEDFESLD